MTRAWGGLALLLAWSLAFAAGQTPPAPEPVQVQDAASLRRALENGTRLVWIMAPIYMNRTAWGEGSVLITQPVTIHSPYRAVLDWCDESCKRGESPLIPYILVGPTGTLTVTRCFFNSFIPPQSHPEARAAVTGRGPTPFIASAGGRITYVLVVWHMTPAMTWAFSVEPSFWGLANNSRNGFFTVEGNGPLDLKQPNLYSVKSVSLNGSTISDSYMPLDIGQLQPDGTMSRPCFDESQHDAETLRRVTLVYCPYTFRDSLVNPHVREVYVFHNIGVDRLAYNWMSPHTVAKQVHYNACPGFNVSIDFDSVSKAIVVQSGGRVAFHRVGLEEQQLPVDENDPSWPQGNKLLMSVFALKGASEFMLDSASIRVSNVSRLLADLMALPRGGGAPTSPNLKPVFADPQPQLSPDVQSFTIESWTLTRRIWMQYSSKTYGDSLEAYGPDLDSGWTFTNVTVLGPRPNRMAFQGAINQGVAPTEVRKVTNGRELRAALADNSVRYIQIISDITLSTADGWSSGAGAVVVSRLLEVRAMRPPGDTGGPYVIDFGGLVGVIRLTARFFIQGSLRLTNMGWPAVLPSNSTGSTGSGTTGAANGTSTFSVIPPVEISGPAAILELQGVHLEGGRGLPVGSWGPVLASLGLEGVSSRSQPSLNASVSLAAAAAGDLSEVATGLLRIANPQKLGGFLSFVGTSVTWSELAPVAPTDPGSGGGGKGGGGSVPAAAIAVPVAVCVGAVAVLGATLLWLRKRNAARGAHGNTPLVESSDGGSGSSQVHPAPGGKERAMEEGLKPQSGDEPWGKPGDLAGSSGACSPPDSEQLRSAEDGDQGGMGVTAHPNGNGAAASTPGSSRPVSLQDSADPTGPDAYSGNGNANGKQRGAVSKRPSRGSLQATSTELTAGTTTYNSSTVTAGIQNAAVPLLRGANSNGAGGQSRPGSAVSGAVSGRPQSGGYASSANVQSGGNASGTGGGTPGDSQVVFLFQQQSMANSNSAPTAGTPNEGISQTRMNILAAGAGNTRSTQHDEAVTLLSVLGEGTYGRVYKASWKGIVVAVKVIILPSSMSGSEKREKMAVMEAAISSSLSHPNIVQTFSFSIEPVHGKATAGGLALQGKAGESWLVKQAGAQGCLKGHLPQDEDLEGVTSWELRLVQEFCEAGSLRELLDKHGAASGPEAVVDVVAVLDTAIDVARAMEHLHSQNIVHSDLKPRNILLKANPLTRRGFIAKVADFGLSVHIEHNETHVSNMYQGTMSHMAPETLMHGRIAKPIDVYAFGITLWESYTCERAFRGVPKALLGHAITQQHLRPSFPPGTPPALVELTNRCWHADAAQRPTFAQVIQELQAIRMLLCGADSELSGSGSNVMSSSGASTLAPAIPSSSPSPPMGPSNLGPSGGGPQRATPSTGSTALLRAALAAGANPVAIMDRPGSAPMIPTEQEQQEQAALSTRPQSAGYPPVGTEAGDGSSAAGGGEADVAGAVAVAPVVVYQGLASQPECGSSSMNTSLFISRVRAGLACPDALVVPEPTAGAVAESLQSGANTYDCSSSAFAHPAQVVPVLQLDEEPGAAQGAGAGGDAAAPLAAGQAARPPPKGIGSKGIPQVPVPAATVLTAGSGSRPASNGSLSAAQPQLPMPPSQDSLSREDRVQLAVEGQTHAAGVAAMQALLAGEAPHLQGQVSLVVTPVGQLPVGQEPLQGQALGQGLSQERGSAASSVSSTVRVMLMQQIEQLYGPEAAHGAAAAAAAAVNSGADAGPALAFRPPSLAPGSSSGSVVAGGSANYQTVMVPRASGPPTYTTGQYAHHGTDDSSSSHYLEHSSSASADQISVLQAAAELRQRAVEAAAAEAAARHHPARFQSLIHERVDECSDEGLNTSGLMAKMGAYQFSHGGRSDASGRLQNLLVAARASNLTAASIYDSIDRDSFLERGSESQPQANSGAAALARALGRQGPGSTGGGSTGQGVGGASAGSGSITGGSAGQQTLS